MENLADVVDRHLISCATGTLVLCNLYPCNFIQASLTPSGILRGLVTQGGQEGDILAFCEGTLRCPASGRGGK